MGAASPNFDAWAPWVLEHVQACFDPKDVSLAELERWWGVAWECYIHIAHTHTVSLGPRNHTGLGVSPVCWAKPWTCCSEENRDALGTEDKKLVPWLKPRTSPSVWWAQRQMQCTALSGVGSSSAMASAKYFYWDHPSTHPSSSCLSHIARGFACRNGFDFLHYLENQEISCL